ncbi:hypothetical protein [Burkholderia diffusa]|nr:hypothetical protein [Burkholderia diffusa]
MAQQERRSIMAPRLRRHVLLQIVNGATALPGLDDGPAISPA